MPRNCCVPLCTTNLKGNPGIPYHEFPRDWERRSAWIKSIYRLAPKAKEHKWKPKENAVVCALHFTEADYKQHTRAARLLPMAVPTVFYKRAEEYGRVGWGRGQSKSTEYNCTGEGAASQTVVKRECEEWTQAEAPQLPTVDEQANGLVFGAIFKTCGLATPLVYSECQYNGTGHGTVSQSVVKCEREEWTNVEIPQLPPPSELEGVTTCAAPMETCHRATSLTDAECQTTLDVAHLMSEARKTELQLKLKLAREKNALRKLSAELSGHKEVLRSYDSNGDIQAFLKVLEAAEDGDEDALLIKNQVDAYARKRAKLE